MSLKKLLFFTIILSCFASLSVAQDVCKPPQIVANVSSNNIFTAEQETTLGDLIFQRQSDDIRILRDAELTKYLQNIGDKIAKKLPETGLKYKFYLIDIPQANAYNTPGGYVFVSRKLVGFSKNENELAGVLAHELGHAVVRHAASDMSLLFKKILKIKDFTDSKDVAEKYNLLIEKFNTKRVYAKSGHETKQQIEADELGLYAMVAAGYPPEEFASFYDRLAENEGKTGSWFSDIFGGTTPSQKRLRRMMDVVGKLPAKCRENRLANTSDNFLQWQADVVSYREKNRKEFLNGLLLRRELSPKLRSDISHFDINADGKYIIAQDDFAITVIQREPLKVAFQIPALNAKNANFTPDGKNIVLITEDLRYEKWNVEKQVPVEIRELVLRRGCWESGLSPDGRYLACVDFSLSVNVIDTKTGEKVWKKDNAYKLSYWEYLGWLEARNKETYSGDTFFNITFSPDSKYLVFTRSIKFRFGLHTFFFDRVTTETMLALDLDKLEQVKVKNKLRKLTSRPFIFLGSDKILAMHNKDYDESGVFSFPEGERLSKFELIGDEIKSTGNPKYVIIKPLAKTKMGFFDIEEGIVTGGIDKDDGTMWEDSFIHEADSGQVLVRKVKFNEQTKVFDAVGEPKILDIPVLSIGNLFAAEVSPNFSWLAISSKTRGGLWNMKTGERKMLVRGFRGAIVGNDGFSIADFPEQETIDHSLAVLDPIKNNSKIIDKLPVEGAKQHGRFVLIRKSMAKPSDKKDEPQANTSLIENVRFELKDIIKKKVVWSEDYPKLSPRFFFDNVSGRMILYWRVGSDVGKQKLKEYPEIAKVSGKMKNDEDNYFVEIRNASKQGEVIGKVLVDTGNRSFSISNGMSQGNWLILYDDEGRVLSYKISENELQQRFFGHYATVNPSRKQILVENYPGEISINDLETGENIGKLILNGDVIFAQFSPNGRGLFVLTNKQTVYAFDMNKVVRSTSKVAEVLK